MVGRYAPSPSGPMHLGNARTALLAWLQARSAGGSIVLRMEDLDPDRSRADHERLLREDLGWLGLDWDAEAPAQSLRRAAYDAALAEPAVRDRLYPCFCTRAEVRAAAQAPHGPADEAPRYPGTCRDLSEGEREARRRAGRRSSLRLRMPEGVVEFEDAVHGPVRQDVAATVGDVIVRRADGVHAYQLAVVVDDAAASVTHVLRGDDLLSSTPRQIVLARLLGFPVPVHAHVPLLLGADGARLAKRHGAVGVQQLRRAGVPADVVVGRLAASAGLAREGERVAPAALVERFDLALLPRAPTILPAPASAPG